MRKVIRRGYKSSIHRRLSSLTLSTRRYYNNNINQGGIMTEEDHKDEIEHVLECLKVAQDKIQSLEDKKGGKKKVRLVAVSKIKPLYLIEAAYKQGNQKTFGENYVQEIVQKSIDLYKNENAATEFKDLEFHFIGHLQSNKCKQLISVRNLTMIETVDNAKLADTIQKEMEKQYKDNQSKKMNVFVQVNTSGEDEKSGVEIQEEGKKCDQVIELVKHIQSNCSRLQWRGLMTIGAYGGQGTIDFNKLVQVRKVVSQQTNIPEDDIELSMGMSADYESAIELGSTNVRLGSTIFGERPKK